uniref:F-box domain-containing protein n=1 Tax=Triticum urartu TaxID=4572 RepID=A0A8R7QLL3_TRIUA
MATRRAPPQLIDDVTDEVLLRLPPDEPEHLFRAALVCKRWLRIICDPGFLRRYRASHGAPPLLGLLHRLQAIEGPPPARFASTTSMPDFPHPGGLRRALDCRHGRVLVHTAEDDGVDFLVWNPVTGHRRAVHGPDIDWFCLIESAVLLCAAHGCDHLDCHGGGPFRVVFAATPECKDTVFASVYSSEADEWSVPVCLDSGCESFVRYMERERLADHYYHTPYLQPRRGAVVGDGVYFTLSRGNAIVKYDLGKNRLSIVDPPCRDVYEVALMAMEDTSLGFACLQGSSLYVWSRKVDAEEPAEWVQCRVIELEKIIPVADHEKASIVVGSAEGVGVIFVSTDVGLFMINLNSGQPKKVDEPGVYFSVLPYMSFYTPGMILALPCLLSTIIIHIAI